MTARYVGPDPRVTQCVAQGDAEAQNDVKENQRQQAEAARAVLGNMNFGQSPLQQMAAVGSAVPGNVGKVASALQQVLQVPKMVQALSSASSPADLLRALPGPAGDIMRTVDAAGKAANMIADGNIGGLVGMTPLGNAALNLGNVAASVAAPAAATTATTTMTSAASCLGFLCF